MHKRISNAKRLLACAGFVVLVSGCAGTRAVPVPTAKDVEFANRNGQATSLSAMTQGRKLYMRRCSACHTLKQPSSLSPADWPEMVERMATNAELKPDQKRVITQYLVGVSAAAKDTSAALVPAAAPASMTAPAPAVAPASGTVGPAGNHDTQ